MKYTYHNESIAPTSAKSRNWTTKDFAILWISISATVVTYMSGSTLMALGMLWWQALFTVFLGTTITLIPIILNSHVGAKYGIPFPVYCRASFGLNGANLPVLIRALVACGWFGIVSWIGAQAFYMIILVFYPGVKHLSPIPFLDINFMQIICIVLFLSLHGLALLRGMNSIKFLLNIKAPLLALVGIVLLFWALPYLNSSALTSIENIATSGGSNFWKVFPSAMTSVIALSVALSVNIADFSRFSKSQKSHVIGQAIGLPLTMIFFAFVGIAVSAATLAIYGEVIWDPVELLGKAPNTTILISGSAIIIIASLTTNIAANLVSAANDFSNFWPKRISFKTGGFITIILGLLIQPWKILANSNGYIYKWLLSYTCFFGAIGGILIADYYLVRKKKLNVENLYLRNGEYWYKNGFNIKAIIAFVLAIMPCIPGMLNTMGIIKSRGFFIALYDYNWFVGFIISFVAYALLSTTFKKVKKVVKI
jgi:NCS1 family nucleobase:cation symporter-1